jgi:hypothetical protein
MSKQPPAPILKMDLLSSAIAGDATPHHVQATATAVFDPTGIHAQEALSVASSPATGCLPCSPLVCPPSHPCCPPSPSRPSVCSPLIALRRPADWHVGRPNVRLAYLSTPPSLLIPSSGTKFPTLEQWSLRRRTRFRFSLCHDVPLIRESAAASLAHVFNSPRNRLSSGKKRIARSSRTGQPLSV